MRAPTRLPLNDREKRKAFFYAEEEADHYDRAAELTQPKYQLLHESLVDLLRIHISESKESSHGAGAGSILDLGCGTGAEALGISEAFPWATIVAVDFSQAMLDRCQENFRQRFGPDTGNRLRTVLMDLIGKGTTSERLLSYCAPSPAESGAYLAVVSAFTFHHFTAAQKARLFRTVFKCLRPGGVFINLDLFIHQSDSLSRVVLRHSEDWIERQFVDPAPEFAAAARSLEDRAADLKQKWLEHVRWYNIPTPIEGPSWVASLKRREAGGLGDASALRRVGFEEVACPVRFYQAGVLWAKR